jgi:transposase
VFELDGENQMNIRHIVDLDDRERNSLRELTSKGKPSARKVKRAHILLMSDDGWADCDIADALPTSTSTIFRTKRRFVEGGVEHALSEKRPRGGDRKLSGREEALPVAVTCSKPPAGHARWTLQLLADEMVRLTEHDSLSDETVRRRLAENKLKPWQKRMLGLTTRTGPTLIL